MGDDPPLQGKAADDRALAVIEFGDGAGAVALQVGDLRQVRGIDNQQSAEGSEHGSRRHGQPKDHAAHHVRAFAVNDRAGLLVFDTAHRGSVLIGDVG